MNDGPLFKCFGEVIRAETNQMPHHNSTAAALSTAIGAMFVRQQIVTHTVK
jgi:hypothetical protein